MQRTVVSTLLAPIAWGTTYVTVTETLPADRPLFVAAVRVLPAGLLLLAFGAARGGWRHRPRGAAWGRTAVVALCNFVLFFPLLFVAVERLPGGVAASAGGLQPFLVLAISAAIGVHRPTRREVLVGLAAAIGVAMVVIRPGAGLDTIGVLAAVAANVSFSAGVVLTKRFPPPDDRIVATGWQLVLGGIVLVPMALLVDGLPPEITARNVAGFAHLSVIGTAVAYVLWFQGIRRLPTAAPPLLGLAAPLTGAVMGWVVLGESLSIVQMLGFALTFAAIAHGALAAGDGGAGGGVEPLGTSVTEPTAAPEVVRSSPPARPRHRRVDLTGGIR